MSAAASAPDDILAGQRHLLSQIAQHVADAHGGAHRGFGYTAEQFLEPLSWFLSDNTDKTPEQLSEMAEELCPGGAHDDALMVRLVSEHVFTACPRLVAACMYSSWKGGKIGFQYLPDPAQTTPEDYAEEAYSVLEKLDSGFNDPRLVLTNRYSRDRDFYDSLPNSFTVYRGAHGVNAAQAAAGLCWTTQRDIAEWFAWRRVGSATPVVVSARVRKSWVRLAFASEHEVVVLPSTHRELRVRKQKSRPSMQWGGEPTLEQLKAEVMAGSAAA